MRKVLSVIALAICGSALAEGGSNGGNEGGGDAAAVAAAGAVAVAGSAAVSGSDSSAQAQGGSAAAGGGSAEGGQGVGSVSYQTSIPRQAPAVYVPALDNTAPGLKCFGFGASFAQDGTAGGGATGWCWLQRDRLALTLYHQHAEAGQVEQAARVFCSKPLLRAGYKAPGLSRREVIAACEQGEADSINRFLATGTPASTEYVDDAVAAGMVQVREDVLTERDAICDEKIARCEAAVAK